MAIAKLVGSRPDVPTCGLTCRDSGLGGPHLPSAQRRALCGHTSPTSSRTVRASAVNSSLVWDMMSPDGRLPIRKMDEHLRGKSTLDPGSKRALLLRTTLRTTLCATPVEGP